MFELHQVLRWIHIAGGAIGVLAFWAPVFAPKGGRTHIRAGWVYVVAMSVAVSTAVLLSVLLLAAPLAGLRPGASLDSGQMARYILNRRMLGALLGYLAVATFALGWHGLAVLRSKKNPQALRTPFNVTINLLSIASGLTVLALGLYFRSMVLLAMSPIGPLTGQGQLRYILRPPVRRMGWWYEHLGGMIGTGIAAYTAFLVFGMSRMAPAIAMYPAVWVAPTVIGVPAILLTVRHYRRKFGDASLTTRNNGSRNDEAARRITGPAVT